MAARAEEVARKVACAVTSADSEVHAVEENSADAVGESVAAAVAVVDEDGIDAVADCEYTEADADSEVVADCEPTDAEADTDADAD